MDSFRVLFLVLCVSICVHTGHGLTNFLVPNSFNPPTSCNLTNLDSFRNNIKDTTSVETKEHRLTIQCPPGKKVNVTFTYLLSNIPELTSFFLVGNLGPSSGVSTNISFVFGSSSTSQTYTSSMTSDSFGSLDQLLQFSPKAFADGQYASFSFIWEPSESQIQLTTPYWKYESGLPLNVIIGIAAGGGILLIALIVIILIVVVRKYLDKRMKRKSLGQAVQLSETMKSHKDKLKSMRQFLDSDIRVLENVQLGKGNFGEVYKGLAFGDTLEVALKKFNPDNSSNMYEFEQEAKIATEIQISTNCVLMMGVLTHIDPQLGDVNFMVFEYMEKGNLLNLLKVEGRKFVSHQLYTMMLHTSQAMCALSATSIVHRDLACRNLLVDKNYNVKLSDFGLSIELPKFQDHVVIEGRFPIRWAAPEVIKEQRYSIKSDVWSFGITCCEILTLGEMPFSNIKNNADVVKVLMDAKDNEIVMKQPKEIEDEAWAILKRCFATKHTERADFKLLKELIEKLRDEAQERFFKDNNSNFVPEGVHQAKDVAQFEVSPPNSGYTKAPIQNHYSSPLLELGNQKKSEK